MKKICIFLFALLFMIPSFVSALEIDNYNVEVNINEDGSADIVENISLSEVSSFSYKNNYLDSNGLNQTLYVGMDKDLYGSNIYSQTLISTVEAFYKDGSPINFSTKKISSGEEYSFEEVKDIVLKYTFSNSVVIHSDVGEFYYNFFRDKFDLNIKNASVKIVLPKSSSYFNATDYRLVNDIRNINNIKMHGGKEVEVVYKNGVRDSNIRVLFDKGLVTSLKHTNNSIIDFFEKDMTNTLINNIKYWLCIGITTLFCINFIRIVILVIIKYGGNKKYKVKPVLDETLVRRYNYAGINYLINKDITVDAFVAGILDLINSGKVNVVRYHSGGYALVRGSMASDLTVDEEYLIKFLFDVIDKKYKSETDIISFDRLKEFCYDNSTVSSFIVNFNVWRAIQVKNAREYKFMVGNEYYFSLKRSTVMSYILLVLNILCETYFIPGIVAFIPVTLLTNVMVPLTKRSPFAEETYKDFINFKAGIESLGRTTNEPYRWDMFLIDSVSMGNGINIENVVREKIKNGSLNEHYSSKIIEIYRADPNFSIVKELLPTLRQAHKKTFFMYIPRKNNDL